jgi:TRAP-type mannitol/chloroaromatic compound transport system permease large subunit
MNPLGADLAPLMLLALIPLLMSGVPVGFALVACGLGFGALAIALGIVPLQLVQALPLRLHGIVSNESLLAIPFFTFMGLVLQRSGMAEELLDTVGEVCGPLRGGLALAVVIVGALLAATTGVVAASVISMGLISLPAMLRNGYHPRIASGVITASGSLTQVVPPSLVLIVMAGQLGVSVADLYAGVLLPAALLIGAYGAWIGLVALVRPGWVPALPARHPGGGHRSLALLTLAGAVIGWALLQAYPALLHAAGRDSAPPRDELVIVGLAGAVTGAFVLALLDRLLRLRLLSALAQRVAFVRVPPLLLIFLVLGTIYLGVATANESGALGASGTLALAAARRRLDGRGLGQALLDASKLSCVVMFLMFGASVFSLSFQALDGIAWTERVLAQLPGGVTGFLVFTSVLIFVLGCFLDFFEIAIVLLPLLGPIAQGLGIDLVWFAVLVGINLQTSFLTPPFGFALFFLRSVAPRSEQVDAASGRRLPAVSTADIQLGTLPFVAIQVAVMALVMAWPALVLGGLDPPRPPLPEATLNELLRDMAGAARATDKPDPARLLMESLQMQPAR